jgi:hypothetical protein
VFVFEAMPFALEHHSVLFLLQFCLELFELQFSLGYPSVGLVTAVAECFLQGGHLPAETFRTVGFFFLEGSDFLLHHLFVEFVFA